MSTLDQYLSVHATAITLRSARAELLAGNLANADTPGYKAKDIDFASAMQKATQITPVSTQRTHSKHIPVGASSIQANTHLRESEENSLDKNSVNTEFERVQFADNDVRYQASVQFLSGKVNSLVRAIRGE